MTVTNEQILAALEAFKQEHKEDLKEIRAKYVPLDVYLLLVDRVKIIEGSLSRVVWLVLSVVIGALLGVVIHPEWLPVAGK